MQSHASLVERSFFNMHYLRKKEELRRGLSRVDILPPGVIYGVLGCGVWRRWVRGTGFGVGGWW
jgi:hypothetical protein